MERTARKDPKAYQAHKARRGAYFPINSVAGLEKSHRKIVIYPRRRKKASGRRTDLIHMTGRIGADIQMAEILTPRIQTIGIDGNRLETNLERHIGKRSQPTMTQVQRAIQIIIDIEGQIVPARN